MDFNSNLILCRVFFVVGIVDLLGTLAMTLEGRSHWIWWVLGVVCLYASLECFLRYRKQEKLDTQNKENAEERLKKKTRETEIP
ncbi:MAG: hypothetical protein COU47_03955 [Candidatus Niyogibacteria bacterium CG10_big_fil_rev_8_21_14_0_10_46_36]|uniref:Uncharacterized protein n=1 Tax=Candidatus Niyogibacteria bacterium CG10_big_fil_rev_8_21_14_0_10_46_36 TaxID=1974726 RepID=A0A2H0TEH6_9BACT|nr:MAG: hypothetical protein COU47_03955 [Candidatus Niyogibacteria bacterium CG10_big_fil_rev_8_21_14_0_10_46_36]